MPIVATHLAACAGALAWMLLEWWTRGKPSVLGMISGAIAGLGTITPASGFVLPWHGLVIGLVAGAVCFWACTKLKQKLGYDDLLDVFGVHGVGGFTGTLLTGVFAVGAVSAIAGDARRFTAACWKAMRGRCVTQLYGIAVTSVWSGVATFVLLKVISLFAPLRVTQQQRGRRPRHHPARRGAAIAGVHAYGNRKEPGLAGLFFVQMTAPAAVYQLTSS